MRALNLSVSHLRNGYKRNTYTPSTIARSVIQSIRLSEEHDNVWIHRIRSVDIMRRAAHLEATYDAFNKDNAGSFFEQYPLYGVPFAVKDNMDVASLPTTCACPGYSYIAANTAKCVANALSKGGILVGKTNLDQFATGLNGTRSAYGTPINALNAQLIPGGSSSGSAVAVASDLVSFSLGTDTAGSGRVPAAMNGILGLKPSHGVLSTDGIVPACKSLDCASIFTKNVEDGFIVLHSIKEKEPELRHTVGREAYRNGVFRFGVPRNICDESFVDTYFEGDRAYLKCFQDALATMKQRFPRSECVEVDFEPLFEVARLLYDGPWVAERLCALPFMADDAACDAMDGLDPTVRAIISGAAKISATKCFDSFSKLQRIAKGIEAEVWNRLDLDFLCVPSIPTTYTVDEVRADPLRLNSKLGRYTNFVNLLDLCAVAMPWQRIDDAEAEGVRPFGLTLIAQKNEDLNLMLYCSLIANEQETLFDDVPSTVYKLCVCGAHLSDGPLNYQLRDRGAKLFEKVKAAPNAYEMYAMQGDKKPGMVKQDNDKNVEIEMEIWCFRTASEYADFIANCVASPLCIGDVQLNDGRACKGFLMESHGIKPDTPNITRFGGWANYKGFGAMKQSKL